MPVFAEFALRTHARNTCFVADDYKYLFWTHDMPRVYNLAKDPKEMNNLAIQPEYREKVAQLKSQLFAWYKPPEISM